MSRQDDQQFQASTDDSNELIESEPAMKNRSLFNILLMSCGFLLIFTAFNTSSLIQRVIVESINKQQPWVKWNAFTSLCIIYGIFSFGNFLTPSLLAVVSAARCLFFSSLTYLAYVSCFLYPVKYSLYIVSVIMGFGAAVIWTAQGHYLTENSDNKTIDRNTGLFWAIFQGSLVFGNLFLFYQFRGVEEIEAELRNSTYLILTIICAIGCLLLLFLRKTTTRTITASSADISQTVTSPLTAFYKCLTLFKTRNMMLLSVACFYSGLELTFYSGVYPAVVGFTKQFGNDSKKLIGIYGCFVGIGSIIGGLVFGLLGKRFVQNNRSRVFILGFVVHLISYILIFINHPNNSTVEDTYDTAYIKPSKSIAFLCGWLLGLGDACFNTQIISLIGSIYTEDSNYTSSAFALYKFTQSIGASIAFFYSAKNIYLYTHLVILVIFSIIGTVSFVLAEMFVKNE